MSKDFLVSLQGFCNNTITGLEIILPAMKITAGHLRSIEAILHDLAQQRSEYKNELMVARLDSIGKTIKNSELTIDFCKAWLRYDKDEIGDRFKIIEMLGSVALNLIPGIVGHIPVPEVFKIRKD